MRKLGQGQSVIFCVPQEIKTKIKELRWEGDCHGEIQVSDILVWSIRETWTSLQRGVQLWASQGRRYEKHERLWTKFTDGTETLSADEAKEFLEDEAQTILQRYRPKPKDTTQQDSLPTLKSESGFADPILERLRDFGLDRCDAAALHEEQERELAPEIETEREQELPPPTMPAAHSLHPDISLFATKGVISPGSKAYTCAFLSLRNTRAARKFEISNIPQEFVPNLLVSADFECTVKPPGVGKSLQDLYLRSVQWVLVSRGGADDGEAVMLVVSPFEANSLIPVISQSSRTTLHIYSPRVNLAFPSLDDLRLFAYPGDLDAPIPRSLTIGLDLFAGQLYFNDHATYTVACKLLGLSSSKATDDERLDSDGFILQDAEGRVGGGSGFTLSPVTFLKDLMLIRRDSRSIRGTHVGDMLDNRPLPGDRFD